MTEIVSIKFKNRGKAYFFSPNGLEIPVGTKVIVETAKGLELADCCCTNRFIEDEAVPQPLRPVVRIATEDDLRIDAANRQREKDAFVICKKKIAEHGLDMKLVDVECNFEGTKTMFFFTSDGRVDFRELVKDLASVFRNRIELRQIGVRDEAKMIGGIGLCGRPYCCSRFLDEFQPVSTKMAKVQSLSLNPTKISGSCGRLMCCLRYEEAAYEDLLTTVPKQGAYVRTKDGCGTAVQVNLLRQTVKVKLEDGDDTLNEYNAAEIVTVQGGKPKDPDDLPPLPVYLPPIEPEDGDESAAQLEEEDRRDFAAVEIMSAEPEAEAQPPEQEQPRHDRRRAYERKYKNEPRRKNEPKGGYRKGEPFAEKTERAEKAGKQNAVHPTKPVKGEKTAPAEKAPKPEREEKTEKSANNYNRRKFNYSKTGTKPVLPEAKAEQPENITPKTAMTLEAKLPVPAETKEQSKKPYNYRRRSYYHKPKPKAKEE